MKEKKISKPVLLFLILMIFISSPHIYAEKNQDFSVREYHAHLNFLSSDLLEGRATGTRGSDLAEAYIVSQFKVLGLKPYSKTSGYFQKIEFDGFDTIEKSLKVKFKNMKNSLTLTSSKDISLVSELPGVKNIEENGDLIFVGYGIKASEYKWDDFKKFNAKDKILVFLVNDPEYKITGFGSESLTYYGRWIYKIEMARRLKAKGILLIHHPREATYNWNVVESGWVGERVCFKGENPNPLAFGGWISHLAINRILKNTGLDYQKMKEMAQKRSFKPFSLKTEIFVKFEQNYRPLVSSNIIGVLEGSDPELKKEAVIYTGHFDHLGIRNPDKEGDSIYNGAVDNASGISALLCLARAFVHSPVKPKRTILFMPVTAEELGLFGSNWYVRHPVFPLKKTAVVINKDCMNHLGKRDSFSAFPGDYSTALPEIVEIGKKLGLKLLKRGKDIGGGAFRSDHFPFAARGVTALSVSLGGKNLSISAKEEKAIRKEIGNTYHRPNDEIHPLWRYDGVLQELELLYQLGRHWADGAKKPTLLLEGDNPYLATIKWYNIETKN